MRLRVRSDMNDCNCCHCCIDIYFLFQGVLMMQWRRGWSMKSTRYGRKTHHFCMTLSWLMLWSGPVLLHSGCLTSHGWLHSVLVESQIFRFIPLLFQIVQVLQRTQVLQSYLTRWSHLFCCLLVLYYSFLFSLTLRKKQVLVWKRRPWASLLLLISCKGSNTSSFGISTKVDAEIWKVTDQIRKFLGAVSLGQ